MSRPTTTANVLLQCDRSLAAFLRALQEGTRTAIVGAPPVFVTEAECQQVDGSRLRLQLHMASEQQRLQQVSANIKSTAAVLDQWLASLTDFTEEQLDQRYSELLAEANALDDALRQRRQRAETMIADIEKTIDSSMPCN